jgi:hypothetical protein
MDHPFDLDRERTEFGISAHQQNRNKNDDEDFQLEDMRKTVQGSRK